MTAVIYARYSSDNQREESIEGQLRECTAFADKNGITVLRHYIDSNDKFVPAVFKLGLEHLCRPRHREALEIGRAFGNLTGLPEIAMTAHDTRRS